MINVVHSAVRIVYEKHVNGDVFHTATELISHALSLSLFLPPLVRPSRGVMKPGRFYGGAEGASASPEIQKLFIKSTYYDVLSDVNRKSSI